MPIYQGLPLRETYDAAGLAARSRQATEQQRQAAINSYFDEIDAQRASETQRINNRDRNAIDAYGTFLQAGNQAAATIARSQDNKLDNLTQQYGIAARTAVEGTNIQARQQEGYDRLLAREYAAQQAPARSQAVSPYQRQLLETQEKNNQQTAQAKQQGFDFHPDQQKELDLIEQQADKIRIKAAMNGLSPGAAQSAMLQLEQKKSAIIPRVQRMSDDEIFRANTAPGPGGLRYGIDKNGRPDYSKPVEVGGKTKPYTVTDWKSLRDSALKELNPTDNDDLVIDPKAISRKMEELQNQYEAFKSGDLRLFNIPKTEAPAADTKQLFRKYDPTSGESPDPLQRWLNRIGPLPRDEEVAVPAVDIAAPPRAPGSPLPQMSLIDEFRGGNAISDESVAAQMIADPKHRPLLTAPETISIKDYAAEFGTDKTPAEIAARYGEFLKARDVVTVGGSAKPQASKSRAAKMSFDQRRDQAFRLFGELTADGMPPKGSDKEAAVMELGRFFQKSGLTPPAAKKKPKPIMGGPAGFVPYPGFR